MQADRRNSIRFAAVGDLLLADLPGGRAGRGMESLSGDVRALFASCDLVFANLEATLPGERSVATEPVVLSTVAQIRSLAESGISLVTLGNNHVFDCLEEGFLNLAGALNEMGIPWFGAGQDLAEASRPAIIELNGLSIGFLGAVDKSSAPSAFASASAVGVAPLDISQICQSIRVLRKQVDHVVVSPHWGMERFRIPSPEQIEQARLMVEAGATMILGHHPHVLQGVETYRGALTAYSLGNFLANNVHWRDGDQLEWNRFERTGLILLAEFSADRVFNIEQIPVFDDGVCISIDKSGRGDRYLQKANLLLQKGITAKDFNRERFYIQTVKPIMAQLKWSKLKRIRPSHLGKLKKLLSQ
ncbi:CapA family protein [Sulfuriflexus sp.]|uniref:CapA family protein n=1 Tax=Sulfuriflexus sp. TaxID=2015443 RepID=UPI0028CC2B83|nr:CapA family protein [Sulfuriflexus sp.]MDT8405486.1 CapA family protein [Sulfuriflexus sp.]